MADIHFIRQHGLTPKKARAATERIAQELAEEFNLDYEWAGNVLNFSRTGVSGHIEVKKKDVEVLVRLGFLLGALRSRIEREMHRFCDENFGPESN
jgi:putative polyhydroxyalkanoate system protein